MYQQPNRHSYEPGVLAPAFCCSSRLILLCLLRVVVAGPLAAQIACMLQILPCVNFVDDCPEDNPVMSHLHLHILYAMLKMSRHKKRAEQPPLHNQAVAPEEPAEDVHIPPVASVEPAEDTVCSSTSTAAPPIQSDRSNSSDAGDGGNVEQNVAGEDGEASGAPAGAFQVVSDADGWVSGSIPSGSSVGSNNGDTSPRSVESAP